ncbi:MAG: tetratricopeptide repeat protein [Bacteroidales bacterium]|nr:tetratricopeptide repeat protein [Bacteroidales bacterium]
MIKDMRFNSSTLLNSFSGRRLLFLIFLVYSFTALRAQTTDGLSLKARKAYDIGQYEQSIQLYEKILSQGLESSTLYYNLGNAYFRNKELPQAILYFEKALKLDPTNSDIKHNLTISYSRITDKVENVPELFYKRWWKALINSFSLNLLAIFIILFLTLSLLTFGIYLTSRRLPIRRFSFYSALLFIALMAILLYAANQKEHYLLVEHEAIVFTPTVTIKSSPDVTSTDLFVIHEGLKVTLLDQIGEWREIRIANGSVGWLKESDIRKI